MIEQDIEFWYWLILGVAFLALEVFAPGAIVMWFGFGAIVTGILLWLDPGMTLGWQILIFSLVSGISVLAWRRSGFFREESTPSDNPSLNNRLQNHVGKEYLLTEAIVNGRGTLRNDGTDWRVSAATDLPAGTRVRVTAIDGIILRIEKAD